MIFSLRLSDLERLKSKINIYVLLLPFLPDHKVLLLNSNEMSAFTSLRNKPLHGYFLIRSRLKTIKYLCMKLPKHLLNVKR